MDRDDEYNYDRDSLESIEQHDDDCGFTSPSGSNSKVITKESLLAAQREDLQRVMEVLTMNERNARTLLIYHRWDVERVLAALVEKGRERLFTEAGVTFLEPKDCASSKSLSLVTCNICIDDFSPNDATTMDCGHCFCNDCWTEYFIVKINEGQSRRIRCMADKCNAICDEAIIRNLVSVKHPDLAERFEHFLLLSYIEDNNKVKWCPSAPHCGNAIRVDGDAYCEVECTCGLQFCFNCTSEAHSPCSCLMWELWIKKCHDESETNNWLTAHTKPCPKCHKPVEKNGGCNLVSCICGQPFWELKTSKPEGRAARVHGQERGTGGGNGCSSQKQRWLLVVPLVVPLVEPPKVIKYRAVIFFRRYLGFQQTSFHDNHGKSQQAGIGWLQRYQLHQPHNIIASGGIFSQVFHRFFMASIGKYQWITISATVQGCLGKTSSWLCGAATGRDHTWSSINGHSCGRYKEEKEKKAERAKRELKRYTHYYSRYKAHMDSLKLETRLKEIVQQKITISEEKESGVKDYSWVSNGLYRLFRSRRVLSYSYAFAYFMFGDDLFGDEMSRNERKLKQHLFEDQQQQLEINVERLSQLIEEPFEEFSDDKVLDVRMKVINLSCITDTRCKKMYECIENDLLGSLQSTTHNIAPYNSKGVERASELSVYRDFDQNLKPVKANKECHWREPWYSSINATGVKRSSGRDSSGSSSPDDSGCSNRKRDRKKALGGIIFDLNLPAEVIDKS